MRKYKALLIACLFCVTQTCFAEIIYLADCKGKKLSVTSFVKAQVVRCIDGDTVVVEIFDNDPRLDKKETVRFVGVDTPETKDPRKPVQYFGQEASDYTKSCLQSRFVYLAFDSSMRDKYQRLLCYVYFSDGTLFNRQLIEKGYAYAYCVYPFVMSDVFIAVENKAQKSGAGLWGKRKIKQQYKKGL